MIYLYISSKKPDNSGKTVVKIVFKFTNARAQGFSPRNVWLMAHINDQIVMAAFLLLFYQI